MLTHDTARPTPLSDDEKEVIDRLQDCRMSGRISIHDLAADLKVETHVIGPFFRPNVGIDLDHETLSQPLRDKLLDAIRKWLGERDAQDDIIERTTRRMASIYSDHSLAKHLGISPDVLFHFLNSKGAALKPGLYLETVAKLSAWLDTDEAGDIDGIAITPTLEKLKNAYLFAWRHLWIVCIVGDVGIGKTFAVKHELRQNPKTRYRPGTLYVELKSGDTTRKAIQARIVQALYDLGVIQSIAGDPMKILAENLGPDDLLIIDEFQFALEDDIKAGKVFHDIANEMKTHVVLQGNPSLNTTLWNEKNQELDGLANRTFLMPHFSTTKEDVRAFMIHLGYDDPSLIDASAKTVARPGPYGGLRTLKKLLDSYKVFSQEPLNARNFLKHAQVFNRIARRN